MPEEQYSKKAGKGNLERNGKNFRKESRDKDQKQKIRNIKSEKEESKKKKQNGNQKTMNRKITTKREDRLGSKAERQRDTGKAGTGRLRIARTLTAVLAALLFPLLVPVTALAGDINSAEQGVLDAISEKQEYEGAYYKVTDGYIAKVTEYLSRDGIDMGSREANDYIAQFRSNIGVGIASGYMEKVGDVASADPENGGSAGTDNNSGTDSGAGTDAGTGTESGTGENSGTGTGNDEAAGSGAGSMAGIGTDPEGDGPVVDNTIGSTLEGAVEYVVLPMDEETMYVQGTESLSVHEEAYKDSPVIGEVKEGEPVKVTGGASTGWAQIAFGEKTGYVSAAYLRTQGYMDRKEAEKKAEEEAKKAEEEKAAEEARKAEEAKAAEEAKKAEEARIAEEEAAQAKDYSNAKPVENSINLGLIALVVVVVIAVILGGVLFYHKKNSRSGKR